MNTDPHNLMNPLREKFPYFIRHEKLYRMIHLQLMKKWFQYFVLFFIIGPFAPLYMAHSRNPLLTTTIYIHSTILLPLFSPLNTDYESQRLQYNMPVANTHGRHAYAISSLFMESQTAQRFCPLSLFIYIKKLHTYIWLCWPMY